jgi:transcriptional regulator with XRE-family HTH domain
MLSQNIKKLRAKRGWTQRDLAKKSGITHATVLKLESGVNDNPTLKTIIALMDVFNVDFTALIERKKPSKLRASERKIMSEGWSPPENNEAWVLQLSHPPARGKVTESKE